MALARSIPLLSKRLPTVRAIALEWRRLTGGTRSLGCRRTLIGCSGGADSSGLVLALASAIPGAEGLFVVGHVVHDLRPRAEALADRDRARDLAAALGLPFVEAEVAVRSAFGNTEGAARRLRYGALYQMAMESRCPYVASAHHADDQMETVLMGLLRGAGPAGLRGAAARRRLGPKAKGWGGLAHACIDGGPGCVTLIRPALGLERAELADVCVQAGWEWREDATNMDESRLRAAIRRQVAPILETLRPGAARRVARSAALMRDAAGVLSDRAVPLVESAEKSAGAVTWPREALRAERAAVVGAALKLAGRRLLSGGKRDRLTGRVIAAAVASIRSGETDPKRFEWSGVEVAVTAHRVEIRSASHG